MQLAIQPGDRVCFNADTIRRTAHDPWTVAFVGTVEGLYCGGKVAEISTNEGIRSVPVHNLAKVTKDHGIVDPSYGKTGLCGGCAEPLQAGRFTAGRPLDFCIGGGKMLARQRRPYRADKNPAGCLAHQPTNKVRRGSSWTRSH